MERHIPGRLYQRRDPLLDEKSRLYSDQLLTEQTFTLCTLVFIQGLQ